MFDMTKRILAAIYLVLAASATAQGGAGYDDPGAAHVEQNDDDGEVEPQTIFSIFKAQGYHAAVAALKEDANLIYNGPNDPLVQRLVLPRGVSSRSCSVGDVLMHIEVIQAHPGEWLSGLEISNNALSVHRKRGQHHVPGGKLVTSTTLGEPVSVRRNGGFVPFQQDGEPVIIDDHLQDGLCFIVNKGLLPED